MRKVVDQDEIDALDRERALIGVFVDRAYDPEKIEWLLKAREGFDHHAVDSWHLLIPIKQGYGVNAWVEPQDYGVALAAQIIAKLGIGFAALPCIVFRAAEDDFFYLKLGGKTREEFFEEIGRISDLAVECHKEGPADVADFRAYVNMQVANHLRRRRLLSATRSALPALCALVGAAVDVKELV